MKTIIRALHEDDYKQVIELGNLVHGDGYLDLPSLVKIQALSINNGISANFVAESAGQIVGFRLTYAAGMWDVDKWCSPTLWPCDVSKMCYFKCNTVAETLRGQGIGKKLLLSSISAAKAQGAQAGVSHLWQQSPNNSAVGYFSSAGGKLIKYHPKRWNNIPDQPDYLCVLCGSDCQCTACEMVLVFDEL
ncbi:GNAT family N-acetyltransferase [Shewanella sp. Scap07]|uniref:GNAT family N-acetyltransferase n=1 Tax=Shewanella sp. Scap07 TaxID=2589987 RepID=UPI0015BEDB2F|nr:GNAT family N-acetyltransferase [Shewanella sp. Scap07]QLE85606.1 GNAT family N-acetyltransferase [Shewanella sp. Scap07]